jgi:ferredoxin-NADP reductase
VSAIHNSGFFDLAVKVYPQGLVSSALGMVKEDSVIEVCGPRGGFKYNHGVAIWGGRPRVASALCLAGGGSGVTPLLQIAKCIADDKSDTTPLYLAVSHSTVGSSMLTRDFVNLVLQFDNMHLAVFTSQGAAPSVDTETGDTGSTTRIKHDRVHYFDGQRISEASLRSFFPPPEAKTVVAWCGPPGFNQHMDETMRDLYFVAENCFEF